MKMKRILLRYLPVLLFVSCGCGTNLSQEYVIREVFGCRFDWDEQKLAQVLRNSTWRKQTGLPFVEVAVKYDGIVLGNFDNKYLGEDWDVLLFLSPDKNRILGVRGSCNFNAKVFKKGRDSESSRSFGERLKNSFIIKYGEPCYRKVCSQFGKLLSEPPTDRCRYEFGWVLGGQVLELKYDVDEGGECSLEVLRLVDPLRKHLIARYGIK